MPEAWFEPDAPAVGWTSVAPTGAPGDVAAVLLLRLTARTNGSTEAIALASVEPAVGRAAAALGAYRLRPYRSCASTHSSAATAEPSDSSPHSTVAAMISASLRTPPLP